MAKYINHKGEERVVEIANVYFIPEGVVIEWNGSAGWGECTITYSPAAHKYIVDDEHMGREFVRALLADFFNNYMAIESEDTPC